MFPLKKLIESDIDFVFMQLNDFGETHEVDNLEITIVIDNDQLAELKNGDLLGIAESELLIFAKASDLPDEKAPGASMNIDGREYVVDSWISNFGIVQIALHQERMI